jgi:drug/metabolite transporter (DMT)-like permease
MVVAVSPILLNEKVSKVSISSILLAMLGMLFMLNPLGNQATVSVNGIIFALLAAVSYASNLIIGRSLRTEFSSFTLSFLCHFIGFLMLLVIILITPGHEATALLENLPALLVMGLASGLGYCLIYYSLKTFVAQKTAILDLTEPLFAIILGVALFSEIPDLATLVGGGLIILGAGLTYHIK